MNRYLLTVLLVLLIPSLAFAHGLSIWSEVKDGKLTIEVNYSSGKPAKNLPVHIYTADGSQIIESGATSKDGIWITGIENPQNKLKIVAGAKNSHHKKTSYFLPSIKNKKPKQK